MKLASRLKAVQAFLGSSWKSFWALPIGWKFSLAVAGVSIWLLVTGEASTETRVVLILFGLFLTIAVAPLLPPPRRKLSDAEAFQDLSQALNRVNERLPEVVGRLPAWSLIQHAVAGLEIPAQVANLLGERAQRLVQALALEGVLVLENDDEMFFWLVTMTEAIGKSSEENTISALSNGRFVIQHWNSAYAQIYLEKNRQAAINNANTVRRLFLLQNVQMTKEEFEKLFTGEPTSLTENMRTYQDIFKAHHDALQGESAARFLHRDMLPSSLSVDGRQVRVEDVAQQDFALFDEQLLAGPTIREGRVRNQITIKPEDIGNLPKLFRALWDAGKSFAELSNPTEAKVAP